MGPLKGMVGEGPDEVEAGADDKYLGRWTKMKSGFNLGMETHRPAFTSKSS